MARPNRPGEAWVWNNRRKRWVKPARPKDYVDTFGNNISYAWDNTKGWVSNEAQASSWDVPLAVINSNEELKALFNKAWQAQKSGKEWTQDTFNIALKNTKWYSEKSEAQRKFYLLENDPAQKTEFEKQVNANKALVQDMAAGLGTTFSPEDLDKISKDVLRFGLNDSEVNNLLVSYISFSGQTDEEKIGSLFGKAGVAEDEIRQTAKDYGVQVSNSWILDQVKKSLSGDTTPEDYKDYIVELSKNQYGQWADKIDKNRSLDFLSSGYKQILADEMNLDFNSIDINNENIKKAMSAMDDSGKPIALQDYRKQLRATDEWSNVLRNKNTIVSVGQSILNKMGFM
jgi:hypothetical protein